MTCAPKACLPALLVLLPGAAAAGTLRITLTPRPAELRGGALAVELTVANLGDEPAHAVVPSMLFGSARARGRVTAALAPGASLTETLSVAAAPLGSGRWPLQLRVDYADATGRAFQALQVQALALGAPPPLRVELAQPAALELVDTGTVAVEVTSRAAGPLAVRLHLLVPEGLQAGPGAEARLAPSGLERLPIPVDNRSLLPGSRVPVYAVAEYEEAGVHQAAVAAGAVSVVAARPGRAWLGWAGAALLAAWLAAVAAQRLLP